ncbi:VanZ family protein [Ancylobacter sonchi]|uniref:VanZ family protein n=1 Tax=Ancylobacter sonchi TaxID=1937790 RepID=UPI001BD4AAA6|nr:VanZ family protein [Ancylobacter sonchi]MBS7536696.1 VanZ family protein [Ancylobacter sonchi]
MSKILKYALCFVLIFGISVLSLLPAQAMWRIGIAKEGEHFAAYFGAVLLIGAAFRVGWRQGFLMAVGFVTLAGLLEFLQTFSPGRAPHFREFLASAAGAVSGAIVIQFMSMRMFKILRRNNISIYNDAFK